MKSQTKTIKTGQDLINTDKKSAGISSSAFPATLWLVLLPVEVDLQGVGFLEPLQDAKAGFEDPLLLLVRFLRSREPFSWGLKSASTSPCSVALSLSATRPFELLAVDAPELLFGPLGLPVQDLGQLVLGELADRRGDGDSWPRSSSSSDSSSSSSALARAAASSGIRVRALRPALGRPWKRFWDWPPCVCVYL